MQYEKIIKPRVFSEGDPILVYDQNNDTQGVGKFVSMWIGPYIVKHVLGKRSYEIVNYKGNPLRKPINGLYLKRYYS